MLFHKNKTLVALNLTETTRARCIVQGQFKFCATYDQDLQLDPRRFREQEGKN